jgi:hypothetical protein
MEAANRKTFWLVWIASAILLSLPALAVTDRIVVAFFAELRLYGFFGSGWGYLPH